MIFFLFRHFLLKDIAAAPLPEKSICNGLNNNTTSPDRTTIPSLIRAGNDAIAIRNSSNKVDDFPLDNLWGTGLNNFPRAEYIGTLLLSPPE